MIAVTVRAITPPVRRALIIAGGSCLVGMVTAALTTLTGRDPTLAALLAQLVVVGTVALIASTRSRPDPLSPVTVVVALFPLLYTVPAFLVPLGRDPFANRVAPWLTTAEDLMFPAARAALLLLAAFLAGAALAHVVGRHSQPSDLERPLNSLTGTTLGMSMRRANILIVVGVVLSLALIAVVGGPGVLLHNLFNRTEFLAGLNYLAAGPLFVCVGGVIRYLLSGQARPSLTTSLVLISGVALLLLTGSKAKIAVVGVLGIGVLHYRYRRVSWTTVAAIAVTSVFALTLYNLYFRDAVPRQMPLGTVIEERGGLRTAATAGFTANTFFGHQALEIAISRYPTPNEFRGLDSLRSLLGAPIPRVVWSEKPPAPSYDFTLSFAPHLLASGTTIPPTLAGEVYISGGELALIPAFGAFGFILTAVHRRRFVSWSALYMNLCCVAVLGHILRGESFGGLVLFLLVLLPGLWVLRPLRIAR